MPSVNRIAALSLVLALAACKREPPAEAPAAPAAPSAMPAAPATPALPPLSHAPGVDVHTYANTQDFVTQHLVLELNVDFAHRVLDGQAELRLQRLNPQATQLILDTRALDVAKVESAAGDAGAWSAAAFTVGAADPILGAALTITLPADADRVRIRYATRPEASGLQWLEPAMTAGKKQPFLFTQSQAIHGRSWIPMQDTPAVRLTYDVTVHTPKDLRAVMSAENDADSPLDGDYTFRMPQAVPSYLIALAVGDLRFKPMGARTGVWAEPSVVDAAASEFADTEKMMEVCERIWGPYRWGRYDLLILPPAFPYGGMENPRLTFATPTIIAGDRSLVSLVAHELAHSWSGNLVTNANWEDFWLNEGFTNHLTYRIMEEVYGPERGATERALGAADLRDTLERTTGLRDRTLSPDLKGRDPDEGVTDVPYEKGALFLAYLESKFGRPALDAFVREWFESHAFHSATTAQFRTFLQDKLLATKPDLVPAAKIEEWLSGTEMPADTVWPQSESFAQVDAQRSGWIAGTTATDALDVTKWSVREWEHFLDELPSTLTDEQLVALDNRFKLTSTKNEILASAWFRVVAANHYEPSIGAMEAFLVRNGRMKLINPAYRELAKTPEGLAVAQRIYARASPGYHPIARASVERNLAPPASP